MMKPNDNFKLTQQSKRLMATIVDKNARDAFKSNMIQAQLQSEIKPVKEKSEKSDKR